MDSPHHPPLTGHSANPSHGSDIGGDFSAKAPGQAAAAPGYNGSSLVVPDASALGAHVPAIPKRRLLSRKGVNQATIFSLMVGLLLSLLFLKGYEELSLLTVTLTAVGVLGVTVAQLRWAGYTMGSAPIVFLLYLALYHISAVLVYSVVGFNLSRRDAASSLFRWFLWPSTKAAILATALAFVGFGIGCVLHSRRPRTQTGPKQAKRKNAQSKKLESKQTEAQQTEAQHEKSGGTDTPEAPTPNRYHHIGQYKVGMLLMVTALLFFAISLMTGGGVRVLFGSYKNFMQNVASNGLFELSRFFLGLGGVLALAGAPKARWWRPLVPFTMMAVPLLMVGSRGPVLFSLLVFCVLIIRRGVVIPRWVLVTTIFVVLILIPLLKDMRQGGIGQASSAVQGVGITSAVVEMGFTLRPVTYVIDWTQSDEEHLWGGSYWLPIERVIALIVPTIERKAPLDDRRFVAIHSSARSGSSMGFSAIAEAIYNFGNLGPLLVFAVMGFVISWFDARATSATRLAVLGIVMLPLVNHVRNSFIFVPFQVVFGLIVLWFVTSCTKRTLKKPAGY
jgi:hypothetical protein